MMHDSWILGAIGSDSVQQATTEASRSLLKHALNLNGYNDNKDLQFIAESLEFAIFDVLDDDMRINDLRTISETAFELMRVISVPDSPIDAAEWLLRVACLGVIGERGADASRFLRETSWPSLPVDAESWGIRVHATILDVWLRLIRKAGWDDLDRVQEEITALRAAQQQFEADYLNNNGGNTRAAAWQLVAFYHLSRAAEIAALYSTQGPTNGRYDIRQQLDAQFDRALMACARAELIPLENLTRLLARTSRQLAENSIWTITRGAPASVIRFVEELTSRHRARPIFEMLPPQRRALSEAGLIASGHRAIVVSLPTSSGKTFIAQFRILQALNQFEQEQGWVAYLAPTRTLVNQICARLRRDFAPLNINVERVSPALEIDALEERLLVDPDEQKHFRVLVTTPEKFDLMLRGDWEEKIGRPLTLVVVDEAHNLSKTERGIKLELLLATVNRQCRHAHFLLLTPFLFTGSADDLARWLSPESHTQVELGIDWQPNDKAICLAMPEKGEILGSFTIKLQTIHTTRNTLSIPDSLTLDMQRPLGLSWSEASGNLSKLAAATAQGLKGRGPLIVLVGKVPHTWSLAKTFKHEHNRSQHPHQDVQLVQRFLAEEFGQNFELVDLLNYGVGVHHAGLSDDARALMEWLLERERLQVLVATTTIAQGVNFPVSGVVLASHQYPYGVNMPPEDFWNLAGRAGRVDQGSVGIVALAASPPSKIPQLTWFVNRNVESLNSTLIDMVQQAMEQWGRLELHSLFYIPAWSSFLQYLSHTYRQIGNHKEFAEQVEQVLRGTLGFEKIRRSHPAWANHLIESVHSYAERISNKPLKLVDSTGFSWESISITLSRLASEQITEDAWNPERLFTSNSRELQKMMGILLKVPELRQNLEEVTGGSSPNGNMLARIITDWVNGASLTDMAEEYFSTDSKRRRLDLTAAMTKCCYSLFGRLTQTASWGLAALQTLTFGEEFERLSAEAQETLRNLPARVFYGVNTDGAIALRLLGVPRNAAKPLADQFGRDLPNTSLSALRAQLSQPDAAIWTNAMGPPGNDYFQIWKVLEG